ncbi:MAG: MMPL family transporter [Pseudomonadota bacterium]
MALRTRTDRLTVRYAAWVVRHRWPVLAGCAVLALAMAAGLPRLGFHDDYRAYFDKGNPELEQLIELQNTYTRSNNVLFVIDPADGTAFDRTALNAVAELTDAAWSLPFATRVDSVVNFQHMNVDGDDIAVDDLVPDAATLDEYERATAQRIAVGENALVHRMISPNAHTTAVNVRFTLPETDPNENSIIAAAVRDLAAQYRTRYPELTIRLTGLVMLDNAFLEASEYDIITLVPIMIVVIVAVMLLLLRSFAGMVCAMTMVVLSVTTGEGIAGWLGFKLTPPSAGSFSMIMTLAVADSVHFLNTFFAQRQNGAGKTDAIIESLRVNLQPVFLTSLTTAIGFLVMNFGDSPPFRDLGNITAIGVMMAFVFSVTFLPALMSVMPLRVPTSRDRITPVTRAIGELAIARRRPLLILITTLVVAIGAMIPRNELDDQFLTYFAPRVDFRTATEFTSENLTGIYQLHYSLWSGRDSGVSDPAFLAKVDDLTTWLREQPEVLHVATITDVFKRLNKTMNGGDEDAYRLPQQSDLAAQYLLFYELSLPFGLDLNDQISQDKSATQVVATINNISSTEVRDLASRGNNWLHERYPELKGEAVGASLMFAEVSRRTIHNMLYGTFVGLVLISALLMVALRDVRLGLISVAPNLLPAGMALGVWGFFVGEINMAVSVIVAMTLGIVVDDTVHFLSKYQRARREQNLDPVAAVRYAFHTVAAALVTTSVVLSCGFAVLMLSTFRVNSVTATLIVVTLFFALLIDFLLLPALLIYLDRRRGEHATTDARTTLQTQTGNLL